ncbi:Kelch repeat-containing protein [Sorangium sp. So ce363]|uniref:Kelch repeat-containing protein n=1 Tax=Sorangium sp. So ce363 TaxID=3133304 RepID=UPI003F6125CF
MQDELDPAEAELRALFPEQAGLVLAADGALARGERGYSVTAARGEAAPGSGSSSRGLVVHLPEHGSDEIRIELPDGFRVRVRERRGLGAGRLVGAREVAGGDAVAYAHEDGYSFWTAAHGGYEEWLLLRPGTFRPDAPVAAWSVQGATLRRRGAAIELADEAGVARLAVTAPSAFARGGRRVSTRLDAEGSTLSLWVDAPPEEAVLVDPLWVATGRMITPRAEHTATLLDDGRVLIAGGFLSWDEGIICDPMFSTTPLGSAEIYDPATGAFLAAAPMAAVNGGHTATRLADGRVLVIGEEAGGTSAELYDDALDAWRAASSPSVSRSRPTVTLLDDGRVLLTGGRVGSADTESTEIYDPATDTWAPGPSMRNARAAHKATRLLDGRVLVTGGTHGAAAGAVEIFDPATAAWSAAAPLGGGTPWLTATLLLDGRVLVTGLAGAAEVYDPAVDAWTAAPGKWGDTPATGSLDDGTYVTGLGVLGEAAARLPGGQVMISGGIEAIYYADPWGGTICSSLYLAHAHDTYDRVQLYDPVTDAWSPGGNIPAARGYHSATSLDDGGVLVAGGYTWLWSTREGLSTGSAVVYASDPLTNGAPCSTATRCASGICVDGVCCASACSDGECSACSIAAGGTVDGVCTPAHGVPCDDGDACTLGDSCDAGVCAGALSSSAECGAGEGSAGGGEGGAGAGAGAGAGGASAGNGGAGAGAGGAGAGEGGAGGGAGGAGAGNGGANAGAGGAGAGGGGAGSGGAGAGGDGGAGAGEGGAGAGNGGAGGGEGGAGAGNGGAGAGAGAGGAGNGGADAGEGGAGAGDTGNGGPGAGGAGAGNGGANAGAGGADAGEGGAGTGNGGAVTSAGSAGASDVSPATTPPSSSGCSAAGSGSDWQPAAAGLALLLSARRRRARRAQSPRDAA